MKRLVTVVIVLGLILGGIALTSSNNAEYVAPEVVIEEKEVQVDALEKAIRDSQESKKAEIESTAQGAYDATYNQEMKKVELQVISDFTKKLEARQESLEGELSL